MTEAQVDPLMQALSDGARVRERLHSCPSSFEARAMVYSLSEAELRAIVLQEAFSYAQQRLTADDYAGWHS